MERSFIIAATARSGSNYLCSLLSNNSLGNPREHFNGCFMRSKFAHAIARGQTTEAFTAEIPRKANQPFGTKILWSFVEPILTSSGHFRLGPLLSELFPKAKYVFLSRRNKLDQAISRARAELTNEWVRRVNDPILPSKKIKKLITPEIIHSMILTILREEFEWRRVFSEAKIKPLEIVYEDLCADPESTVVQIGRFIVGSGFKLKTIASPLTIQRDVESELIRQTYLAATGGNST